MLQIADFPSPNHGPRRGVAAPNMIVVHYTAMSSAALALARLCSPEAEVSAHYLVDESGQVFRLVSETRRAWHAGAAAWGPVSDVNSHSIGIELSHPGHAGGPDAAPPPFPEAQMAALEALMFDIRLRWGVPAERVLGHSDVAVGRKIDPGQSFDWRRLAAAGLAVTSDVGPEEAPPGPPEATIAMGAMRIGYHMPEGETGWADLLRALQMRFVPEETGGPASRLLSARVSDLARRHPAASTDRPGYGVLDRPPRDISGEDAREAEDPPDAAEETPRRDLGPDFDLDTE